MLKCHIKRILPILGVLAIVPISIPANAGAATGDAIAPDYSLAVLFNTWTGKCADLPGYDVSSLNAPVTQYTCDSTSADNQLWHTTPTRSVNGIQLYEFVNAKGGLRLDLPDYGSDPARTHLYVYYCNAVPANDNQEWYLQSVPGSVGYLVRSYKDGLCLDASGHASDGSDLANGLPLTAYSCFNSSWANGGYDDHI
jgi:hypothetical protein